MSTYYFAEQPCTNPYPQDEPFDPLDYDELGHGNLGMITNTTDDFGGYGSPTQWEFGFDSNSPTANADPQTATSGDDKKKGTKRRPRDRPKACSEASLNRRREQNRVAQRAYRERKDQRLKELEEQLAAVHKENDSLSQAYQLLAAEYSSEKMQAGGFGPGVKHGIAGDDILLDHMLYGISGAAENQQMTSGYPNAAYH